MRAGHPLWVLPDGGADAGNSAPVPALVAAPSFFRIVK